VGLYGERLDSSALDADDLAGVARALKRAGDLDRAREAADVAVQQGGAHALRARAEIAKARGDRARALADFETLAQAVDDPSLRLELAKLYEHFVKEPSRALAVVEKGTGETPELATKRVARLTRKARRQLDLVKR
jgi:hypothetical protein